MPDGASAQAQPPIENRPSNTPFEVPTLPDSNQKGYIEVSTAVPPPTTGPFTPPPPLTDSIPSTPRPAETSNTESD
jgi:hypothetical protein